MNIINSVDRLTWTFTFVSLVISYCFGQLIWRLDFVSTCRTSLSTTCSRQCNFHSFPSDNGFYALIRGQFPNWGRNQNRMVWRLTTSHFLEKQLHKLHRSAFICEFIILICDLRFCYFKKLVKITLMIVCHRILAGNRTYFAAISPFRSRLLSIASKLYYIRH